jgi:hypothetical protein
MYDEANTLTHTPLWQQSIRDKCVHPDGTFVPFTRADPEQSIAQRFEPQVRQGPTRLAAQAGAPTAGGMRRSMRWPIA